jgi:hypothetical protein
VSVRSLGSFFQCPQNRVLQGIVARIQKEDILEFIIQRTEKNCLANGGRINKEMYEKFVSFITSFAEKWEKLPQKIHSAGFEVLSESLEGFYGGELAKNSFIKEATFQRKLQELGLLKMSPSGLVVPEAANIANSVPIHKNTFYGERRSPQSAQFCCREVHAH